MKPTVLEQRNLLDLHTLILAHSGLLTRHRTALGAGQANISQTRSSSFRIEEKDVLARAGRVSRGVHICPCLYEVLQSVGAARDRDDSGRRARYGGWQARCREVCTLGTMCWHD